MEPGIYSLRIGVVDAEGRRGSVIRDVSAWKMAGESFALGDLIVGGMPTTAQGLTVQVEPYVLTEGVAAYLEMYSTTDQTWNGTTVTFEVADDADSAPLASVPVTLVPGRQPTWRVASGVINAKALPPGRYVARAKIARDGKAVGVLSRPFVFEHEGSVAPSAGSVAVAAAAVSFASSLPKFDSASVLKPEMIGPMLDMAEKRSPATLKDAMTEARAGRYGPAALEAFSAGDQTVAAFFRGLDLYAKGQIDQAATQFQVSAGPRREFFPSAFYLGALFAAAGRDQDAAGVWQIALGSEPRPAVVYMMVADARLRTGQAVSAIDILKPAYERDPAQEEIARRLAMAYSMTGRHADALPVLDNYLTRTADGSGHAVCRHRRAIRGHAKRTAALECRSRQASQVSRQPTGAESGAGGEVPADDRREVRVQGLSLRELTWIVARDVNRTLGGGLASMELLRRTFIANGSLDEAGNAGLVAVSRLTPGTNILAYCVGLGWSLHRWAGALAAVAAASLPASFVVCVLTIALVRDSGLSRCADAAGDRRSRGDCAGLLERRIAPASVRASLSADAFGDRRRRCGCDASGGCDASAHPAAVRGLGAVIGGSTPAVDATE